jgi:hypothetical protein
MGSRRQIQCDVGSWHWRTWRGPREISVFDPKRDFEVRGKQPLQITPEFRRLMASE